MLLRMTQLVRISGGIMSILQTCLMQFYLAESRLLSQRILKRWIQLFADYHINLVQMLDSGKLLFHNEDVRILYDVVSNIYRNNIDYIYSKYDGTRVDKDLLWMIGKITENKDMIELSEIKEGESVDMCDAWKRYIGEKQREVIVDNIIFMIRYGIPKKDLLTKFTEEEYNEALSKMKTM